MGTNRDSRANSSIKGENEMGIIVTLIGIVVILSVVSTIYVEDNPQLSFENAKEFGYKVLDTIEIWRTSS